MKKWFLLLLAISLFISCFFIPPFQKPDEPLHFKRAYSVSLGQFVCQHTNKYSRGYFTFPKSVDEFPKKMMSDAIIMKPEGKFPYRLYLGYYPVLKDQTVDLLYTCTLPFTGYIPAALGMLLFTPLNNLLVSFYAARLFLGIAFFVSIYVCFRILPKKYWYLLALSSILPVTVQQATAISYDSMAISTGYLFFALFMRMYEKKRSSIQHVVFLFSLLIIFLFTKPGYYSIAFLLIFPIWLLPVSKLLRILILILSVAVICLLTFYRLALPI
jgi:uncharacterized membrane protein